MNPIKKVKEFIGNIRIREASIAMVNSLLSKKIRRRATQCLRRDRGQMRVVRLIANFTGLWDSLIEQTPGGSGQWGNTLFVADGPADFYVILNSISRPFGSPYVHPDFDWPERDRVWGLHMEPSDYVRKLGYDLAEEHDHISRYYTNCDHLIEKGGIYRASPPYVPFHLGKTWDFLAKTKFRPERQKYQLGIICSHLNVIEGHGTRLEFLERLDASGIPYALWGRGKRLKQFRGYRGMAESKWEVHSQCRYSIVLENTTSPWYWSEKPVDSLLSYSLPIYHGCPRLGDYLPNNSFVPIDIRQPESSLDTIKELLCRDPYPQHIEAIQEARRIILQEQNLFAFLDREISGLAPRGET